MSSAYALGRLVWRPMNLVMLFPIALSLLMVVLEADGVSSLWSAHAPLAFSGVIVALIAREPQAAMFGWTLPGLNSQMLRATAAIGILEALIAGAIFTTAVGVSMGVAMFGSSLLAFALGMDLVDSVRNRQYRAVMFLVLVAIVFRPEYPHRAALISPVLFGLLTGCAAAFIFYRSHSRATMRNRPFVADMSYGLPGVEALRGYWAKRKSPEQVWSLPLQRAGVRTWISAAIYESFNGRAGGWPRSVTIQLAIGITMAYALNGPWFVALSIIQMFVLSGLQLRMKALYPLSRERQARLNYAFSLFENALLSGVSGVAIWLLYSFGPGHIRSFASPGNPPPILAAAFVGVVFALAPLAQWAKTRGPLLTPAGSNPNRWSRSYLYWIAFMVVYLLITTPLKIEIIKPATAWSAISALAVVVQALYWLALRRHFRRADLITSSP